MDVQEIVFASVTVGIVLGIWFLCREFICKVMGRILLGILLIVTVNLVIPQYAIGINWLSMGCAGVLGVPGVVTLYVINAVI